MNRTTLLILVLVVGLVAATSWLSQKSESPSKPADEETAGVADYFIRGFEGTVTGNNGRPTHYLKADYLVHYTDSNITELEKPDLTVYQEKGEKWHIQSELGRMQEDGENDEVLLQGNVTLTQQTRQQPLKLSTETLLLYPERQYAETDSAVDIRAPGGHIRGVGMKVFGQEERLQLLSDIRGTYEATIR